MPFYVLNSSHDASQETSCDASRIDRHENNDIIWITSSYFLKALFDQQSNFKNDFPGWIIFMPR